MLRIMVLIQPTVLLLLMVIHAQIEVSGQEIANNVPYKEEDPSVVRHYLRQGRRNSDASASLIRNLRRRLERGKRICQTRKTKVIRIKDCPTADTTTSTTAPTPPPPITAPTPSSGNSSMVTIHVPFQVNGIFPGLTATAASGPTRSECGTGALMPWVDKLYMVSYLSTPDGGSGTGLYAIDENFTMTTVAQHNSTFANRIIHRETNQIIIGAWVIDMKGNARVFPDLLKVRIAATAEHLTHPSSMIWFVSR